ncbi:unnamed protein product, partial [Chrysoparadoxa australica]
ASERGWRRGESRSLSCHPHLQHWSTNKEQPTNGGRNVGMASPEPGGEPAAASSAWLSYGFSSHISNLKGVIQEYAQEKEPEDQGEESGNEMSRLTNTMRSVDTPAFEKVAALERAGELAHQGAANDMKEVIGAVVHLTEEAHNLEPFFAQACVSAAYSILSSGNETFTSLFVESNMVEALLPLLDASFGVLRVEVVGLLEEMAIFDRPEVER